MGRRLAEWDDWFLTPLPPLRYPLTHRDRSRLPRRVQEGPQAVAVSRLENWRRFGDELAREMALIWLFLSITHSWLILNQVTHRQFSCLRHVVESILNKGADPAWARRRDICYFQSSVQFWEGPST